LAGIAAVFQGHPLTLKQIYTKPVKLPPNTPLDFDPLL